MISITINLNGVDKKLASAPSKLKEHLYKRLKSKTAQLKVKAKRVAPEQSGKLSRAIYGRTYKEPLRASLGISEALVGGTKGFSYAYFVAGGVPITTSNKYNRYFAPNKTIYYGQPALSPSGNPIEWTAEPGWWINIISEAKRAYPATAARAVKDFTKEMNT